MREELKDFDFKDYVELKEKTFIFQRAEYTFITGAIYLKKLCNYIGHFSDNIEIKSIKIVRRTVLFDKERFCEIAIIDLGDNYLVQAAKFKHPAFRFGFDFTKNFFNHIYITTKMRFFLINKNDKYINFLLQKLSKESKDNIVELVDSFIEEMLLSKEVTGYKKYVFPNSVILKHLFDVKSWWRYSDFHNWYKDLPIKVTSEGDFKKVEFDTKDIIQENEEYYTKVDVLDEKLTIIKIKTPTPWTIFKNTILDEFPFEKIVLPIGTDIYIKNFEKRVYITFYDGKHREDEDLFISVSMITSAKIIICQPLKTEDSFYSCFNEEEVMFSDSFLVNRLESIIKSELKKHIANRGINDINIYNAITGTS